MTVTAAAAVTAAVVAAAGTAAGVGAVSLPPHFLPPRPAHREAQERRERAARAAAGGSQRRGSMGVEEGELAGAEKSTGCACMEGDCMGCLRKEGKGPHCFSINENQ